MREPAKTRREVREMRLSQPQQSVCDALENGSHARKNKPAAAETNAD